VQLLTYMKLAGVKTGLLMNFNVTKLKSGIKRFVLLLRALRVLRGETILYFCERRKLFFSPVRCTHSSRKGIATPRSLRDAFGSSSFPYVTFSFAFLASLRESWHFTLSLLLPTRNDKEPT
jgi:hypothetical protein